MKRLLLLLLFASLSWGQTPVTVIGTIQDSTGSLATSGYVEFQLSPTNSSVVYYVSGTTVIAPQTARCGINASGLVKNNALTGPCQVWGVDIITPANLLYCVTYAPNGVVSNTVCKQLIVGSTYSLNAPVFGTAVNIVPQYQTITTSPIAVNLVPAIPHVFTVGNSGFPYGGGYFDNLFLNGVALLIPPFLDVRHYASVQAAIDSSDCPTTGCIINATSPIALGSITFNKPVLLQLGLGTYSFTGITYSNPSIIQGAGPMTWLQYTPTTGTAISFGYTTPNVNGAGLRDLRLFGPGPSTSTIGLAVTGGTDFGIWLPHVTIDSFGLNLKLAATGAGFFTMGPQSSLFNGGKDLEISAAAAERITFLDSGVFSATTYADCATLTGDVDVHYIGGSFDFCQLAVSAGKWHFTNTYFEVADAQSGGAPVIVQTGGTVTLDSPNVFYSNAATRTFATVTIGELQLSGGYFKSSSAGATPIVANTSGTLKLGTDPTLSGYSVLYSVAGTGVVNPNGLSFVGNSADYTVLKTFNNAAGAVNWQMISGATGSVGCGAGTIGFWTGVACPFKVSTTTSTAPQFTSTVATGTAPLVVASTTNVANLNASSLNGATFAAPGAIGGGTPAAGTFTALTVNSNGFTPTVLSDAPGAITVNANTCTERTVAFATAKTTAAVIPVAQYALDAGISLSSGAIATANTDVKYRICNNTIGNITLNAAAAFNLLVVQ